MEEERRRAVERRGGRPGRPRQGGPPLQPARRLLELRAALLRHDPRRGQLRLLLPDRLRRRRPGRVRGADQRVAHRSAADRLAAGPRARHDPARAGERLVRLPGPLRRRAGGDPHPDLGERPADGRLRRRRSAPPVGPPRPAAAPRGERSPLPLDRGARARRAARVSPIPPALPNFLPLFLPLYMPLPWQDEPPSPLVQGIVSYGIAGLFTLVGAG